MGIMKLFKKYKDIIAYGFFGVCTTLVNVVAYWFMAHVMKTGTMPSTIVAWIVAVLFAYVTNRKWVFHSEAQHKKEVLREIVSFFTCRLATGVVDWACMFICVDIIGFNDVIIKVLANILVIILNYIASKLFVFKKKGEKPNEE